jgi:hypothetical protein
MIEVKVTNIRGLKISTSFDKEAGILIGKFSFESKDISAALVGRLLNAQKQGRPLEVSIQSPQGELDLRVVNVNTSTGEMDEGIKEHIAQSL